MKISGVKAVLSEKDILSIIKDYLNIEGLTINSIYIKETIIVKGNYKKKINIPFSAEIGIGNICDNILNIKIFKVNVLKVGILSSIKKLVLKKLLKDYSEYGIKVDKDTVILNLDLLSKLIPYFYVRLNKITMMQGALEVQVENAIYAENKERIKIIKSSKIKKTYDKHNSGYSKVREKIIEKCPDKYEKVLQYAMLLPDIAALLWRLFKDKRVTIKVKIMVAGVAAYLVSPIDIIPDFIPFIGTIDDVAIAFFGLNAIINEVPEEIILENWMGEENIILITKEAVNYISKIVGSQNVGKLLLAIKKIFTKGEEKIKKSNGKLKEEKLEMQSIKEIAVAKENTNK